MEHPEDDDGPLRRRTVWEPGDINPRRPPLTDAEVRPLYTEVRLVPFEDLPIAQSDYPGPERLRWSCLRGCGATEEVRTRTAALNLSVTHRCPAADDKDPASCAEPSPPSSSPASRPPQPSP